jgi:anti-sigma-K factor RskA
MRENPHPVEQEELMAYLDGELSVDQAARTAAHLQECRECQAFAAELKSVAESLTAWDVEQKEPQLSAGLAQALEERERHSQAGDPRGRWYWLGFWRLRGFAPWVSGAVAGAMAVLLLTLTLISSFSRGERRLGSAARSTSNTEQRLTDLLRQRTGKLSDVLEVETEFSHVHGEIEQMEAQRRLLSKQVEFSTITATVTEEFKAQA